MERIERVCWSKIPARKPRHLGDAGIAKVSRSRREVSLRWLARPLSECWSSVQVVTFSTFPLQEDFQQGSPSKIKIASSPAADGSDLSADVVDPSAISSAAVAITASLHRIHCRLSLSSKANEESLMKREREIEQMQAAKIKQQEQAAAAADRHVNTCRRAVKRMLHQQLAASWTSFLQSVTLIKANREAVRAVIKRMSYKTLTLAFDLYATAVSTIVAQRQRIAKVMGRLRNKGLTMVFEGWVEYVDMTRQERAEEAKELAQSRLLADQQDKSSAMIAKEAAAAAKEANRRIDMCQRVVRRMLHQQLATSWMSFCESVMQSKADREVVHKVLKRMSQRSLALAFECFAEAVSTIVAQRQRIAKAMGKWTMPGLIKAFEGWVEYVGLMRD